MKQSITFLYVISVLLLQLPVIVLGVEIEETDNNHGELDAINMALQIPPTGWPHIKLGDSSSTRTIYRNLRDKTHTSSRMHIRKHLQGISIAYATHMRHLLDNTLKDINDCQEQTQYST